MTTEDVTSETPQTAQRDSIHDPYTEEADRLYRVRAMLAGIEALARLNGDGEAPDISYHVLWLCRDAVLQVDAMLAQH